MKVTLLTLSLLIFTNTTFAAMTEKECESQAKTINSLVKMIESGTLNPNSEQVKKIAKAKDHFKKGEFCQARKIVLNLGGPQS